MTQREITEAEKEDIYSCIEKQIVSPKWFLQTAKWVTRETVDELTRRGFRIVKEGEDAA